jgi:hypothetical protein
MHRHHPPPNQHNVQANIEALPHVGTDGQAITHDAALAAFLKITAMRSGLSANVSSHNASLLEGAVSCLEPVPDQSDTYVITRTELNGIIAKAGIMGAMQAASDIGQGLIETRELYEKLAVEELFTPGENGGAEGLQPAA